MPPVRGFSRIFTVPSAGARSRKASIEAVRAIDVEFCLVALPVAPDQVGFGGRDRGLFLRLRFRLPLLRVAERELGLLELDRRDEIALAEIELGAVHVVLRLHDATSSALRR